MREMQRFRVGIRVMDVNAGTRNQCGNAGNLGGNMKNQGGGKGQNGSLSIAIEMT